MDGLNGFGTTLLTMLRDVFPIAAILFGFQALVLRRKIKDPARVAMGMVLVLLGLTLFLEGLEMALFPIGRLMAQQLTAPEFIYDSAVAGAGPVHWLDFLWIYAFAAAIGKTLHETNAKLKPLVGDPSDEALVDLMNPIDCPDKDIKKVFDGCVASAKVNRGIREILHVGVAAPTAPTGAVAPAGAGILGGGNIIPGAGMQQALEYADILDIPFIFSSNGDGFI